jgi:hypothetical protein
VNTETSKQIRFKVGALFFFFFLKKYTLSTKLSLILILFFQILKSKIEAHILLLIVCQIKYFCIFVIDK